MNWNKTIRIQTYIPYILTGVLLTGIMTGCRTTAVKEDDTRLSSEQVHALYKKSQDPRKFWLTVYPSDKGPVFSGANRVHPNQWAHLSMSDLDVPAVTVRTWGSKEYTAVIDSSSKESWIDYDTSRRMKAITLGPQPYERSPSHVRDSATGFLAILTKFKLDHLHVENALFYIRGSNNDLGPLKRTGEKMHGAVLGSDILQVFRIIQFDFAQKSVMLSSTLPYEPVEAALIAEAPVTLVDGRIAIKGMVSGKPETIVIDTAGDYELAVSKKTDQGSNLILGDLVLQNIESSSLQENGLSDIDYPRIGLGILKRFKVTIDNRRGRLYFERSEGT